jgi:alkanesulfonate monooxygenase SsuD/methylene tetrahydromethanopterin reductase-like flavin-dependent oxidoreductase (luciferase family)
VTAIIAFDDAKPSGDLPVRFGLHLPQIQKSWTQVIEEFTFAEEVGFDTAWLSDHLLHTTQGAADDFHESWTLLAAIAARTSTIRLGILVTSNTLRHPAVLAKEAVTVDHISGGRLILGVGSGWKEDEHVTYGVRFPPADERVGRLEETLQIIVSLMQNERTTFHGRYYTLIDAPLRPRPLQRPRIPILIAAHRPRMLAIAARYADQWDTYASQPGASTGGVHMDVASRVDAFDSGCRTVGRDPRTVRRSTSPLADVFTSANAFIEFVREHRRLGFTDFTLSLSQLGARGELRSFAERSMPGLRRELSTYGPPVLGDPGSRPPDQN